MRSLPPFAPGLIKVVGVRIVYKNSLISFFPFGFVMIPFLCSNPPTQLSALRRWPDDF